MFNSVSIVVTVLGILRFLIDYAELPLILAYKQIPT
jgi:hypothetical protein